MRSVPGRGFPTAPCPQKQRQGLCAQTLPVSYFVFILQDEVPFVKDFLYFFSLLPRLRLY